jgi:hypothetical protein
MIFIKEETFILHVLNIKNGSKAWGRGSSGKELA